MYPMTLIGHLNEPHLMIMTSHEESAPSFPPYWADTDFYGSYIQHGTGMDTIENNGSMFLCSV